MVERIPTGIPGLDGLMEGGIPAGFAVLVSGSAGAGKTILGIQFLASGCKKKQKAVYISFDMSKEGIATQAEQFGWDLADLEKKGLLKLLYFDLNKAHVVQTMAQIRNEIEEFKPERVVLDSISVLGVYSEVIESSQIAELLGMSEKAGSKLSAAGDAVTRRAIMNIIGQLKDAGVTSLVVSELPEESHYLSRDTVSEYACDGVILLKSSSMGETVDRTIEIRKMRKTKVSGGTRKFEFTDKGIKLE